MVKEFRKTKNSGILLCLDKRDNIINLAYVESDLTDADKVLLGLSVEEENTESIVEEAVQELIHEESVGLPFVPEEETAKEVEEIINSKTRKRK